MNQIQMVNEYRLEPAVLAAALKKIGEDPYDLGQGDDEDGDEFDPLGELIVETVAEHGYRMHEGEKVTVALFLRILALARFVEERSDLPEAEGRTPRDIHLDEALMRCAVDEPVMCDNGNICFDHLSFTRRLLATVPAS